VIVTLLLQAQSNTAQTSNNELEFIQGTDLSALLEVEEHGGIFKENGLQKDILQILKDHNINYVRLKIWHSPITGYNGLPKVIQMASRIKLMGLKFLLDFHYSDTWADPGSQIKPAAWQGLSFQTLKDSVYEYSKSVISSLKLYNVLPDMIQIGNEITCGFLWDEGRVCNQFNSNQQWNQFAGLIKECIRGVKENIDSGDSVKIAIHIDRGGDNTGSRWFFDNLIAKGVDFDIIGLSYYPWWHGTLSDLEFNVNDLAQRYGKNIILLETAYPWTLTWNDNTNNIVGNSNQLLPGYPAEVEGQKKFIVDIKNLIKNIPNNKGSGFFYWEPDWITAPQLGSPWENVTLFDFSGELLNSITAFDSTYSGLSNSNGLINSFSLKQNFPNPFNPATIIEYSIPTYSHVTIKVYDILGVEIKTVVNEVQTPGDYKKYFDGSKLSNGVYFYQLKANGLVSVKKMILLR
ncbi:MAG: glycosyl hydrolase 53 family protein, partial [Ignavibacteriaceae bacterium]|nr:glycosyl hydrolase 53 family protein [Ignavibacteriaceae bacterium]